MTSLDLAALAHLAEQAMPHPLKFNAIPIAVLPDGTLNPDDPRAQFIAAASPEVVRELIGRVQKALEYCSSITDTFGYHPYMQSTAGAVAAILRGEQETT